MYVCHPSINSGLNTDTIGIHQCMKLDTNTKPLETSLSWYFLSVTSNTNMVITVETTLEVL